MIKLQIVHASKTKRDVSIIELVKIIYAKGTNLKHSDFIIQTLQTCRKCAKIQQDEKCDGWQL
jgi:hypothetical protein